MTGTIGRLRERDTKSPLQRAINKITRSAKLGLIAPSIGTARFEPIIEPPKRRTKILFKPGEREALEAEAKEDERNGRYYEAGVKYAEVENPAKAREMADACKRAYEGQRGIVASALIHERIEEYC